MVFVVNYNKCSLGSLGVVIFKLSLGSLEDGNRPQTDGHKASILEVTWGRGVVMKQLQRNHNKKDTSGCKTQRGTYCNFGMHSPNPKFSVPQIEYPLGGRQNG